MVGCSAPNCHNRSEKGMRHFAFPADKDRRKRWLINCRRDKWVPTSTSRLCEEHFDVSQFENKRVDGWRKLKPSAVPTLFSVPNPPPLLLSKRRVLKRLLTSDDDDNNAVKVERIGIEHSYAKSSFEVINSVESAPIASTQLASITSESSDSHVSSTNKNDAQETTAYEIVDSSFLDLDIVADVETITSQLSPRKQVRLENLVQSQERKIQELSGQVRRLKRQLKKSQSNLQTFKAKVKAIFSSDQIHVLQKGNGTNRGGKWSAQTVQRSLQVLFACGPSGYKLLISQGYPLPATRTLRKSLEGIRFDSGLLKEVFELLRLKVAEMHDKERDCALTLDEMSLTPSAEYDTRTGRLIGEVTLPGHSGRATHAMVFMLSGISTRWKQTVAYYFTGNSVYGSALKTIIVNIITKAWEAGLRVITVTCDMGACNRTMWSTFGICCGRMVKTINRIPHPCSSQHELHFLADSPHLIKNLKAALVNGQEITLPEWVIKEHNLSCNTVTANHLHALLTFQDSMQLKISPGLTKKTLAPNHFDKMKVSNAMSFFSHSNAAGLEYIVRAHNHSTNLLTTAWFLKTMNRWFDLVSSRRRVMALSLMDPVQYGKAVDFLRSIIHLFETVVIGNKGVWKPVQTGIILTTQSIINVADNLLASGYKFILTSRLTSDCIENLFSCVRTNNAVPSPLEFKNKLRLLSASQFLRMKSSSSYAISDSTYLVDFASLSKTRNSETDDDLTEEFCFTDVTSSLTDADFASLYYLAGYIVSRVLKSNKTCETCIPAIKSEDNSFVGGYALLLKLKSYKDGCLVSCTSQIFEMLQQAENIFRSTKFNLLHHKKNVHKLLLTKIQQAFSDVRLPLCHDVKRVIVQRFVTLRLRIWAKDQRALLKDQTKRESNGELGSKSMAMRMAVSKFK